MQTLNLGILAHVDAGKTSLTERLLFAAGVIDEIGSVDDGSTQTDSLALERQRGITIKSAVASFTVGDITVNLIDTPGHPDFIAEVERVLSVLDGAVLVISAVEGVQPQSRVLMRALRRLRIPVLIFVNKIDRAGARIDRALSAIAAKLTQDCVAMESVHGAGTPHAHVALEGLADGAVRERIADLLADHDDGFLAAYVSEEAAVSHRQLTDGLAGLTRRGLACPVFFGSAMTGAGVRELTAAITRYLPLAMGDADGRPRGTIFKVERGQAGETIAYARMFSGTVRPRDRLRFGPPGAARPGEAKVTAVTVPGNGPARNGPAGHSPAGNGPAWNGPAGNGPAGNGPAGNGPAGNGPAGNGPAGRQAVVAAGQIGKLWGLRGVRIGDVISAPEPGQNGALGPTPGPAAAPTPMQRHFAAPTLEAVVIPRSAAGKGALHVALTQLAEQDPLINLRQDDIRQELIVSLYGEVQKEVIQATLADDFGLDVSFRETTPICIERVIGTGSAAEIIDQAPNPFLATVGLRVGPAPAGSGVRFGLGIELGALPFSFLKAIEDTVRLTLAQGLHGWQVSDAAVTLTQSGYWPRQSHAHGTFDASMSSTAGDFRNLTPLVLMAALRQAGTRVCEPVHRFKLETPAGTFASVLPVLTRLQGVPLATAGHGQAAAIEGEIPAARVHELQQQLPALTHGEGILASAFDHYQPVRGQIPVRSRTDRNPLNRKEYLLRVER